MTADARIALIPGHTGYVAVRLDADRVRTALTFSEVAAWVQTVERDAAPRWIMPAVRTAYPALLERGIRLRRAHDLTLCHAILRDTALLATPLAPARRWRAAAPTAPADTLFAMDADESDDPVAEALAEYDRQMVALAGAKDGRLAMLCAAESAGALIGEEMHAAGLPWSSAEHHRLLEAQLGTRSPAGGPPSAMVTAASEIRRLLGDAEVNIDSPPKLLRALHRVGVDAESTSRWVLTEYDHPVIAPLLTYKKMSRLYVANGWTWLAEWVRDERFRPVYVPGGVVTGRWASAGGGALQLPRQLRPAVRADAGWTLIVADVAQLEPRMLAAMAADTAMARAAQGADLYAGVVSSGAVATREEAKYAVLGAMYGATTGDSGRLVPRLRTVFPRAMRLVDEAARIGEDGGTVSTWLGRSSPPPSASWQAMQADASGADVAASDVRRARQVARDRGRFTRNFVVQGTAAEWSLMWLAEIRHRLAALAPAAVPAPASGPFAEHAHLAFFLHDEIIVHTPIELADAAAEAVRDAAETATRRMFGDFPIEVPLDLRIADTAEK